MRILFINDDGYDAVGLNALYSEFAPHHECRMCAPLRHKSAFSHAINFQGNLEVLALDHPVRGFALDGTPADCTKMGLDHLFRSEPPFDIVLSGINYGVNIGKDVFYSGTVAAAREAMLMETIGIAFSQSIFSDSNQDSEPLFPRSARHARQIFEALPKEIFSFKKEMVLSLNFPKTPEVLGIKVCTLVDQVYQFNVQDKEIEGTRYLCYGDTKSLWPDDPETDRAWLSKGYVTATALYKGFDVHPKAQEILKTLEHLQFS